MSYAFLDVKIGNSASSRIIIQLYEKDAPETCRFFKFLLNHPHGYKGTHFHRIIEEFMIQGGNIDMEVDASIGTTPRMLENIDHPVDKRGLVGLARTSAAENNSQFFITLVPAEHLKGVHTIFGYVVKGFEVAEKIGQLEVDNSDKPTPGNEVIIVTCGELQPRKSLQSPSRQPVSSSAASKPSHGSKGKSRERSRSPRRDDDRHRQWSRSPGRREEHRSHRHSNHPSGNYERRRHHHHHGKRRRSPAKEDLLNSGERDQEIRPERHEQRGSPTRRPTDIAVNDSIPTRPRAYKSRQRYRPESNYGRLGYDVGYDDNVRDDECRLREVERHREGERSYDEPTVTFKGRGAMKYREQY
jgi:peptidyl-prolyl isomerase G (cyclophilin G)